MSEFSGNRLKVNILGVSVNAVTQEDLHQAIGKWINQNTKVIIPNVNIHGLNLAYKNRWFRDFLNQSEIVFCDGFGVKLGAKILGQQIGDRITYADWTWNLAALAAKEGFSLFLLGSKPGVADRAASRLTAAHPGLKIAGTSHGYFDRTPGSPENEAVVAAINQAKPNILIVGFGMPLQEQWIRDNFERLHVNVFLPAGAALDYVAGEVRRAPRWMTDHGLEWLGRLLIEPRRLWKRYLIGIPLFFWRVLKQRFKGTGA